MRDFSDNFKAIRERLSAAHEYLGIDAARTRLAELEVSVAAPDLWDNADHARSVTSEYTNVMDDVKSYDSLLAAIEDAETLWQLGVEEKDESIAEEVEAALTGLAKDLEQIELSSLF